MHIMFSSISNKFASMRLFRRQGQSLHTATSQQSVKFCLRYLSQIFSRMSPSVLHRKIWSLYKTAYRPGCILSGGISSYIIQSLFNSFHRSSNCSWHPRGNTMTNQISTNSIQGFWSCIHSILTHSSMNMTVKKPWQNITVIVLMNNYAAFFHFLSGCKASKISFLYNKESILFHTAFSKNTCCCKCLLCH